MKKLKLKEDADGNKTATVQGNLFPCKVMKQDTANPLKAYK